MVITTNRAPVPASRARSRAAPAASTRRSEAVGRCIEALGGRTRAGRKTVDGHRLGTIQTRAFAGRAASFIAARDAHSSTATRDFALACCRAVAIGAIAVGARRCHLSICADAVLYEAKLIPSNAVIGLPGGASRCKSASLKRGTAHRS